MKETSFKSNAKCCSTGVCIIIPALKTSRCFNFCCKTKHGVCAPVSVVGACLQLVSLRRTNFNLDTAMETDKRGRLNHSISFQGLGAAAQDVFLCDTQSP